MKILTALLLALVMVTTCSCRKPETVSEANVSETVTEATTAVKPVETTEKPTEAIRPTETVKLEVETAADSVTEDKPVETAALVSETKTAVPVKGGFGYISFTIPDSWGEDYSMKSHKDSDGTMWTEFQEEPDFSDGEGGWLCSIIQFPGNEITQYNYLPNYEYLGEIRPAGEQVYGLVLEYPSDVQPSIGQMDKYFKMYDDIELLKKSITAKGAAKIAWGEGGVTEYIMPESDFVYFSEYDLKDMTKEELRLARNEIYARHGRKFRSLDLQEYFNSKPWYEPTVEADRFDESVLNEAEKYNIKFIEEYENSLK